MRKIILIVFLVIAGQLVMAQYAGFTAVADLSKFTATIKNNERVSH